MTYHMETKMFDTEDERNAWEVRLKRLGFYQVPPINKLKEREYKLIDGTSDYTTFEGQKKYGIVWCEG